MRISYNWLKSLLPPLSASPGEIARRLTLHSFETQVTGSFEIDPKVIIAKIVKVERHPQADRLQLATIDLEESRVTVVCGAPNIAQGDYVPYAPPGAVLMDKEGNKLTVRAATIRGQMSPGMLTSLRELGLGPEHGGIWLLPHDVKIGEKLGKHVPADTILETDLTPNRAHDAASHIGVARELAALFNVDVEEPALLPLPTAEHPSEQWRIDIRDNLLCRRYLGVVVDNLASAPSPLWLQVRLIASGGKPINNLVDITNYVMFEYGNPLHLFDRAKLSGHTITVRSAAPGERLITLDKEERGLDQQDIVIACGKEAIALAGVIGGQAAQIEDTTTAGLLEVGNFNAFRVQETARRVNIRTESSVRFSKDIDPNFVTAAAQRAVGLLQTAAGASVTAVIDKYPHPRHPKVISLDPALPSRIAGVPVAEKQAKQALERLRFRVAKKKTAWEVTVPTDRLDVMEEHDVVEEVVRMSGLNEIAAAELKPITPTPLPHHIYWREVVRDTLMQLGMSEVYNASFEPAQYADIAGVSRQPHITVANPPAPELSRLRVSLIPGLLANLAMNREILHRNVNRGKESAFFEIGNVYRAGEGGRVPGIVEEENLAGVIVGRAPALDDIAASLGEQLGISDLRLSAYPQPLTAALKYRAPLTAFEVNLTRLVQTAEGKVPAPRTLDELKAQLGEARAFTPIAKYPAVYRDLSIIVDPSVAIERVQEVIERAGGQLVADVDLFDVYSSADDSAAAGRPARQSLAFHITYQSPDKTLTDDEVAALHNDIVGALHQELDATLRE